MANPVGTNSDTGFNANKRTLIYYVEAVKPSEEIGDLRILFEVQPDERAGFMAADAVRITAVQLALTPDYNRDGRIDSSDRRLLYENKQFHIWVNDDCDKGKTTKDGGSDVPGQGLAPVSQASFFEEVFSDKKC